MPAFVDLVVNDGTADRTYARSNRGADNSVTWVNRSGVATTFNGYPTIRDRLVLGNAEAAVDKRVISFAYPLERTESGTGTISVAGVARVNIDVIMPRASTAGERTQVAQSLKSLMAVSGVTDAIAKVEAWF